MSAKQYTAKDFGKIIDHSPPYEGNPLIPKLLLDELSEMFKQYRDDEAYQLAKENNMLLVIFRGLKYYIVDAMVVFHNMKTDKSKYELFMREHLPYSDPVLYAKMRNEGTYSTRDNLYVGNLIKDRNLNFILIRLYAIADTLFFAFQQSVRMEMKYPKFHDALKNAYVVKKAVLQL